MNLNLQILLGKSSNLAGKIFKSCCENLQILLGKFSNWCAGASPAK